jgi:uncharacterized protein YkwD
MRRWEASIAVGAAVFVAMVGPSTASATVCANAYARIGQVPTETLEGATLCLVNEQRIIAGLRPVVRQPDLMITALRHSWDMQARGYFAHVSPDGEALVDRIGRRLYLRGFSEWYLGENLGWGQRSESTPAATVLRWMLSPEHRANVLDPGFTEAGVGVTPGAPPPEYRDENSAAYVLNFGARRGQAVPKRIVKRSRAKREGKKRRVRLPDPAVLRPPSTVKRIPGLALTP